MDNKPPQIGDRASDFVLKDQHNKELRFSDLRNRVLLSIRLRWASVWILYPANTPGQRNSASR